MRNKKKKKKTKKKKKKKKKNQKKSQKIAQPLKQQVENTTEDDKKVMRTCWKKWYRLPIGVWQPLNQRKCSGPGKNLKLFRTTDQQ